MIDHPDRPGAAPPLGVGTAARARSTISIVAFVALALALILLLFNIYLLFLLRSLDEQARVAGSRVAIAESALQRAAEALENGPISVPVQLQVDVPIRTTIRLDQTIQFPVRTEVPIQADLDIPITTPFGDFNMPVPVDVKVPVNTTVPVAIDESIPISATVPISINRPVTIDLRETEIGAELRRLRQQLQTGR